MLLNSLLWRGIHEEVSINLYSGICKLCSAPVASVPQLLHLLHFQAQETAHREEMAQLRLEIGAASSNSEAAVGQANCLAVKMRT